MITFNENTTADGSTGFFNEAPAPSENANIGNTMTFSALPEDFRNLIEHIAKQRCVTQEVVGLTMLSIVGGIAGANAVIKMGGRTNRGNLYTMVVAPSGSGKSAPMEDLMQPVFAIDKELVDQYRDELAKWKEANKGNKQPTEKPKKNGIVGAYHTDASRCEMLYANQRGVIEFHDELTGLFRSVTGKYNESTESHLIGAYNNISIKCQTKTEDTIYNIATPCLSILGGIQPALLKEVIKPSFIHSGFLQRFIAVSFDGDDYDEDLCDGVSPVLLQWWDSIVHRIYRVYSTAVTYEPTPDVAAVYEEEYRKYRKACKGISKDTPEGEYRWNIQRKALYTVHRLCLLATLLRNINAIPAGAPYNVMPIEADTIRWAFSCVPYIVSEQMKIYQMICGEQAPKRKTDREFVREVTMFVKNRRPNITQKELADFFGMHKQNIHKYVSDIFKEGSKEVE